MARRQSRVGNEETDAELDLTPMLDVVFILLIFFIVTSVFVKEPGVEVVRPETEILEDNQKPTLLVAVSEQGEIWIDNRIYQISEVRNVLEQLLEENPKAEAMIQGDDGAPVGLVLDVQDLMIDLEIESILISTEDD